MRSSTMYALGSASTGTTEPDIDHPTSSTIVNPRPARPPVKRMPPWKVLLHNDNRNEMGYVVETIIELTAIKPQLALVKMVEAHKAGVALLLSTHREYAELLQEQFQSKGLTVTIEPDR